MSIKTILHFCLLLSPFFLTAQSNFILPDEIRRPTSGMFHLELRSMQVSTKITGQSATTSLDQVFYNPGNRAFQGYYYYPLPKHSSIGKFTMYINGKETPGELLDAKKAKSIYEGIVRKMQDPALLEYSGQELLRIRIFPVPARGEQRVKLTYTHSLPMENGTVEYVFPMKQNKIMESLGTVVRPDRRKPEPIFTTIPQISFRIEIEGTQDIKTLYCPTHEMEIVRKDDRHATLGFESQGFSKEQDLKIYYSGSKEKMDVSILNFREEKEDGFFFLNLSPGLATREEVINKDITFVLDASGSMAGEKMNQAKQALSFCINNLNEKDRFNIVRFSTEASALYDQLATADKNHVQEAEKYIKDLKAIGGTNIEEALEMALNTNTTEGRPHFIVFLSDGKPTIGETGQMALLQKVKDNNSKDTRIFTFGIGTNLNTHLLDGITQLTQAYRTYVLPDEDIEIKVSDFFTKVSSPILTNLKLEFPKEFKATQVYPKNGADLFKGSTLSVLGRYSGKGNGNITLSGMVNGKKVTYNYPIKLEELNTTYEFIPPMWATRAVGYLLEQIRLQGNQQELIDEVVRLSKAYGIITPYTSYLILEDEQQQIGMRNLRQEDAIFSNRMRSQAPASRDKAAREYESSMKQIDGKASVQASEELQDMNASDNLAKTQTGKARMNYKDQQGQERNLTDGIRYIQGRAIYQNGNQWIDAQTQLASNQSLPTRRVQFNSEAYFKLIKEAEEHLDLLALGKNVRFLNGQEIVEVYE